MAFLQFFNHLFALLIRELELFPEQYHRKEQSEEWQHSHQKTEAKQGGSTLNSNGPGSLAVANKTDQIDADTADQQ